jgi:superfamily II DNA or RNA helicase
MYEIIKLLNQSVYVIVTSRCALVRQIIASFTEWSNSSGRLAIYKNGDGGKIVNHIYKILSNLQNARVNIIVSTYDSLVNIKNNFSEHNIPIDLIIYDEAHNTVGDEGKRAQGTIHIGDVPLIVNKHLFMTATPIAFHKFGKFAAGPGEDTVYTMDNEETYGNVIFNYSLNDAIRDGVITDWDVYPLHVTDDCNLLVGKFVSRLESATKQEQYKLGLVFLAKLVNKIIIAHSLNNMIIYLNSITEINDLHSAIEDYAPDVVPFKIHSRKGSDSLEKIVSNLKPRHQCILVYGMIDEGTDIPSCDSVLFVKDENRENKIIQRIGRALRKFPGKDRAKIFIPTIIENDGGTIINNSFVKTREVIEKLGKNSVDLFTRRNFNIAKLKIDEQNEQNDPGCSSGALLPAEYVELHDDDVALITNMTDKLEAYNLDVSAGIASVSISAIKSLIKQNGADNIADIYRILRNINIEIYAHDLENFVSYAELFERESCSVREFCAGVKSHFPNCFGRPVKEYKKEYSNFIVTHLAAGNNNLLDLVEGMPIIPELFYKDYLEDLEWPFNENPLNELNPADKDNFPPKEPRISINPVDILITEMKYSLLDNKFTEHRTDLDLEIIKRSLNCNKVIIKLRGKNKKALKQSIIIETYDEAKPRYLINPSSRSITPMKGGGIGHLPTSYFGNTHAIYPVVVAILNEIEKTYGYA